jgi:hypothetical protein
VALELREQVVVQRVLLSDEGPYCWVIKEAVALVFVLKDVHQGRIAPMAGTVLPSVACQASAKAHGGECLLEQLHLKLSQVIPKVMEYVKAHRAKCILGQYKMSRNMIFGNES